MKINKHHIILYILIAWVVMTLAGITLSMLALYVSGTMYKYIIILKIYTMVFVLVPISIAPLIVIIYLKYKRRSAKLRQSQ
jgi:hypothetical protein